MSVTSPPRTTALSLLAAVPFYRGAAAALFLSGLGFSAAAPQIATFLVRELDASLTTAGLYYLTNLTAPVAGYLIGARSDRTGKRLGLFRLCAAIGGLGWVGIALSHQLWMPFVLSALALAVAGAATSQLFAALHDELEARPSPGNDGVVAIVRMALTAGWVVGPVLGTILAAQAGSRGMLLATAAATLAQILPLGLHRERGAAGHGIDGAVDVPVDVSADVPADGSPVAVAADGGAVAARGDAPGSEVAPVGRPGLVEMLPLPAFTGLYVCVYAGESIKYAYLPLYMADELHLPAAVSFAGFGTLMSFAYPAIGYVGIVMIVIVCAWWLKERGTIEEETGRRFRMRALLTLRTDPSRRFSRKHAAMLHDVAEESNIEPETITGAIELEVERILEHEHALEQTAGEEPAGR